MKKFMLLLSTIIMITVCVATFASCGPSDSDSGNSDMSNTICRITFDSQGGSEIASIECRYGDSLQNRLWLFIYPQREGYFFDGWFLDRELTKPFALSQKITSDLCLFAKWAKVYSDGALQYKKNDDGKGYSIIWYENGEIDSELSLPREFDGLPVTSISGGAFTRCEKLISVSIPDSITYIGNGAFQDCNNLQSVEIPSSVIFIGEKAFGLCTKLSKIEVAPTNEHYLVNDGILYSKDSLSIMFVPKSISGEIVILDGVTVIEELAFEECAEITKIVIPDSVTSIGTGAFAYCTALREIVLPKNISIVNRMFYHCTSLTKIAIPSNVLQIYSEAFCGCTNLTEISMPNSLMKIFNSAFTECDSLVKIRFDGTKEKWESIIHSDFYDFVPGLRQVVCIDGTIDVMYNNNIS